MAAEIGPQDSAVEAGSLELSQTGFDPARALAPEGIEPRFEDVARLLKAEPWSFDFFHAVRLLERFRAGRRPVGLFEDPSREVVRFGAHSSLSFPASSIQSLDPAKPEWKMLVNFIGLTGPMGVLPRLYTVAIQDRARIRDGVLRDFLDIFNHRATSLFYRAWTKYRLPIRYQYGMDDQMSMALASLVGLGTPGLLNRADGSARREVEDESYVWLSGLFALQARSAVALEQALEDYFRVPAEVVQFVGAWCRLEGDSTCTLDETEDPSEQLGLGAVVGDEVYDHQARVRVRLGPLTLAEYRRFLPGQPGYRRLRELTRFFSRDQIDFEVQLILRRTDVPDPRLAEEPAVAQVQLGWTTWMKNRPDFPRDPEDTILFLN